MIVSSIVKLLLVLEVLMISGSAILGAGALSTDYYDMRCGFAEQIVTKTVDRALRSDPTLAAGLLRMHFHDCFIQGCDGSVLIDSTEENTAEKDSPANLSLRGYEIIDHAKDIMETQCPGVVSCADIVAMAARDAVYWTGGPYYDIPKGRMDGRISRVEDTINLPPPTLNTTSLIKVFGQHGFNVQELVALLGSHTIGAARCSSFKNRLSNFDSIHDVDPTLDSNFAKVLSTACRAGDKTEMPLDWTRNSFDNGYFNALQKGYGVLNSDQTLFVSQETAGFVNAYAMSQAMFFYDFQQAMVKMGLLDVKEGDQGEVRSNCRKIN